MAENNPPEDFTRNVNVTNVCSEDTPALSAQARQVVQETPLTIEIKDVGTYTIMSTPSDKLALAVGFVFSEGLIENISDINLLNQCPDDPDIIRIQLSRPPDSSSAPRNLLIVSSCGICGSEDIETIMASLPEVCDTLEITTSQLVRLGDALREHQTIFQHTGGTHAAGIVRDGEMVVVCEDIGRHNALDKAIGTCLLKSIPIAGACAVLSGRVSFEMVAKAARAGIELIAAVSAPSTLALDAAQRCNITLCGFVRPPQATIYTHPHRISAQ